MASVNHFVFNGKEQRALRARGLLTTATYVGETYKKIDPKTLAEKLTDYLRDHAIVSSWDELVDKGVTVPRLAEEICGINSEDFREEAVDEVHKVITGRLGTTHTGAVQKRLAFDGVWLIKAGVFRDTSEGYDRHKVFALTNDVQLLTRCDTTPRREQLVAHVERHQVNDEHLVDRQPRMRAQVLAESLIRIERERELFAEHKAALTAGLTDDEIRQLEATVADAVSAGRRAIAT